MGRRRTRLELGERLRKLRERKGLTQVEAAALMGRSQPRVSALECGYRVELEGLDRYITALGGRLVLVAEFDDGEQIRLM